MEERRKGERKCSQSGEDAVLILLMILLVAVVLAWPVLKLVAVLKWVLS